jgi:polyhydroxybutyrate depolymerase
MNWSALGFSLCFCLASTVAGADCNGAPVPCTVANGTYHIAVPQGATGPFPAILLLHGYGGEGVGSIRNKGMVNLMLARGYAVIAPDGQQRRNGAGRTWDFHPDRPATRDEVAFLILVADDTAAKYNLKRDDMLLAGFSIGGSMTSYVACAAPNAFAAYAPMAGSFWRPHPRSCAGPVRLLHTHGKADKTVPLLGREVGSGFKQGNVYEAMGIWRATNNCPCDAPDDENKVGLYTIQHWDTYTPVSRLDFALHDGGHSIPKGWTKLAMDRYENR